jgi:hypothetical protein
MHRAALNGHTTVVQALLGAGVAADTRGHVSQAEKWRCAEGPGNSSPFLHFELVCLRCLQCGFSTPLHRAAMTARTDVMHALLEAGAIVDSRDDVSAMHFYGGFACTMLNLRPRVCSIADSPG